MSGPQPDRRAALAALAALAAGCAAPDRPAPLIAPSPPAPAEPSAPPWPAAELPPPAPRELRGAWVATVANIDWPSRPGLAAAQQRAEALALLDRARALNLNLLVLQVRPAGDAIYPSALEPWTEFLSGEQGRAPWLAGEAPWDPLAFWLEQAHARAIELHVWFNPYRARHSMAKSPPVSPHLAVREPALVRRYGEQLWMDPGEPAAAAHTLAVVADVLRRYAVDGVHIDDYFYPYPVLQNPAAGPGSAELPFPDDAPYARHRAGGGTLARDDWRRANVDTLVQQLHDTVRRVRPGTRFGISPFGIGRPDRRPPGITGFSQYDKLYADVETWVQRGWLDYLVPQLYWPIDRPGQEFPALLAHWRRELQQLSPAPQRHLWPGLFTSQVKKSADDPNGPRAWPAAELLAQVALMREQGTPGHIHFSMVALMGERAADRDGLATALQRGPYAEPALVPATPWLDDRVPAAPTLRRDGALLRIEPGAEGAGVPVARWALWRRIGGQWRFAVLPGAARTVAVEGADRIALAAVSRTGVEGARHLLAL